MHVLNTTRKVVAFITRNIKNPQFLFLYSLYFFQKEFRVRVSFFSNDEVIALVTSGKSLLRLGDGEIGLLNDRGIIGTVFLQKSLPVLKQGIYRIITGYTKNSPYVIALPKKYASYSNEELRMEGKLRSWLPFKVMYSLIFPKDISYADAHMFYSPKYFEAHFLPFLKQKKLIFVINETKVAKLSTQYVGERGVHFVPTPSSNAGEKYHQIKKDIERTLDMCKGEETVLIFSCGPVGKVLLHEFSLRGVQGIDLGEAANVLFEDTRIDHLV